MARGTVTAGATIAAGTRIDRCAAVTTRTAKTAADIRRGRGEPVTTHAAVAAGGRCAIGARNRSRATGSQGAATATATTVTTINSARITIGAVTATTTGTGITTQTAVTGRTATERGSRRATDTAIATVTGMATRTPTRGS